MTPDLPAILECGFALVLAGVSIYLLVIGHLIKRNRL